MRSVRELMPVPLLCGVPLQVVRNVVYLDSCVCLCQDGLCQPGLFWNWYDSNLGVKSQVYDALVRALLYTHTKPDLSGICQTTVFEHRRNVDIQWLSFGNVCLGAVMITYLVSSSWKNCFNSLGILNECRASKFHTKHELPNLRLV